MKLKINLTRKPAPGGVFNCKVINIREIPLQFLLTKQPLSRIPENKSAQISL